MTIKRLPLPGLLLHEPRVHADDRGYFFESYNAREWAEAGVDLRFVQDNQSASRKGVLRGLHYQLEPFAQAKLVRVVSGEVLDVAVDLRAGSPTFGQHHAEVLSGDNKRQMLVPVGFAHGFVVLSDECVFFYKCSNVWSREHERGIRFDDPALGIDWRLPADRLELSLKDLGLPLFSEAEHAFEMGETTA